MGAVEVEAFLTHLAVEGRVAAATQNLVLSALLFLYREVLNIDLPWLDKGSADLFLICHSGAGRNPGKSTNWTPAFAGVTNKSAVPKVVRAKQPQRLPVVLTRQEVTAILDRMSGVHGLMVRLLYGTGMRLMECVRLQVKDVDFERAEIVVREGMARGHPGGAKDRARERHRILA